MVMWRRYLRILSAASTLLSIVAVIIGIYSFILSLSFRRHDIAFEVVPKLYDKYYEMYKVQLEHPYLGHMFASPDRYAEVARASAMGMTGASDQDKAKYWLEERAVADFIWTYYEQLLFQWYATRDEERNFLVRVLNYLEDILLRNPRLVWWWYKDGGGLETSYEDITRCEIFRNALNKLDFAKVGTVDPNGPFGYHSGVPFATNSSDLQERIVDCKRIEPVRVR